MCPIKRTGFSQFYKKEIKFFSLSLSLFDGNIHEYLFASAKITSIVIITTLRSLYETLTAVEECSVLLEELVKPGQDPVRLKPTQGWKYATNALTNSSSALNIIFSLQKTDIQVS